MYLHTKIEYSGRKSNAQIFLEKDVRTTLQIRVFVYCRFIRASGDSRDSLTVLTNKKKDRRIAGRKKAPAIERPFPDKKNRSRNILNGLTETDQFSAEKKEDRRS
ncbi:hypothetical protein E3N88_35968 [Mikania micrantha]|uniref:Uncharacterized protein n=1 Tax=Mikania micrantha TaxID=192012 RepID=A0A5N6M2S1_9ASTR|nr:hypothetical protein E3N88_35968 [Mikania micrantha]